MKLDTPKQTCFRYVLLPKGIPSRRTHLLGSRTALGNRANPAGWWGTLATGPREVTLAMASVDGERCCSSPSGNSVSPGMATHSAERRQRRPPELQRQSWRRPDSDASARSAQPAAE